MCLGGTAYQASSPGPWTQALRCANTAQKSRAAALTHFRPPKGFSLVTFLSPHPLVQSWMCVSLSGWAKVAYPHLSCKEGWEHKCLVLSRSSGGGELCLPSGLTMSAILYRGGRGSDARQGEMTNLHYPCLLCLYPSHCKKCEIRAG